MIKVTVWHEFFQENVWKQESILEHYPDGMHKYIESFLKDDYDVKTVTQYNTDGELNENAGITRELLDDTDVMIWWGHCKHGEVPDEAVKMVADAVRRGMGIIFLHSAHHSKPFKALMGTSCNLHWRESEDKERLWAIDPSHPIAKGIPEHITLEHEEMYGEPFGIPEPDKLVFIANFEPGEVFRAGCCWRRENGKVFYFQPGHESYPTYHNPYIQQIIKNAIEWAYSEYRIDELTCPRVEKPND